MQFEECNACRAKPGSPVLCPQCLMVRELVSKVNDLTATSRLEKIKTALQAAMRDFIKYDPAYGRIRLEWVDSISLTDLATDIAPYFEKHWPGSAG